MRYIISCDCSGTPKRAEASFSVLFPNESLPEKVIGKNAIRNLADQLTGEAKARVQAMAINKDRQAYFLETTEQGDIVRLYNLLTGKVVP